MAKFDQDSIQAVIFDMDGLMIDSEPLHCEAYDRVLKKFGYDLTKDENSQRYVGIGDVACCDDLISRHHLPITTKELMKQKQGEYLKLLDSNIKAQPGLLKLLDQLQKNNYKKAIASGSLLYEIKTIINSLKIEKFFDAVCSVEEVQNGKPEPDLFLLAARRLEISPERCLVLEDAPSGIKAAVSANMKSYAIPSRETLDKDFSLADRVLPSLEKVYGFMVSDKL